jgi:hypothetical protein
MTREELVDELRDCGFDYLSDAQLQRWVNQGYLWLCDLELWPFRESSAQGDAPLEITDLGQIESVKLTEDQTVLPYWPRHLSDADLTESGTPEWYYVEDGTEVRTYPDSDDELIVRYWATPFELDDDDDEPVIPERYQGLIVDAAAVRGYRHRDDHDVSNALRQSLIQDVQDMRVSLLSEQGGVILPSGW